MKNLINKMYKNRLSLVTKLIIVFPILPLIVLSIWALALLFLGIVGTFNSLSEFNLIRFLWAVAIVLWIFGGFSGLLGGSFALQKKYTKTTLVLFIHGAVSYAIVAVTYIVAILSKFSFPSFLLALYLMLTLVVITIHLVKLYENVTARKATEKEVLHENI